MAMLAAWLFNIMLICEIDWEYVGLYSALIARGVVRAPSDSVFWWHEDTIQEAENQTEAKAIGLEGHGPVCHKSPPRN